MWTPLHVSSNSTEGQVENSMMGMTGPQLLETMANRAYAYANVHLKYAHMADARDSPRENYSTTSKISLKSYMQ